MRMPGVPTVFVRVSMPAAVLVPMNVRSALIVRVAARFVVPVVLSIVAHHVRYPLIVLASPSLAFLRVTIEQPLLRTLTTRLGESIDALCCR
jgi:hypothetical protein